MKFFSLLFSLIFFLSVLSAQNQSDAARQLQVDVVYLSSNLLEGRMTGSSGEQLAAAYIAARFGALGLVPKGQNGGWFHDFDFKYNANPHATEGNIAGRGKNVVGFLDNKAPYTVVIGAHYDHLGYGLEGSSLHAGEAAIHNGADDNASGVACMLWLADYLSRSSTKNNNYLFIAFSGEEMGLFGSKRYAENPTIDLATVNYMLNMDMVGRLKEEKILAINGAGTSPKWKEILPTILVDGITAKTSDSGIGPSDQTSFYLKEIPVLHFFTGQHKDYHKPSDDSELVNYPGLNSVSQFIAALIEGLDSSGKLPFTKTKEEERQAASFKVSLGVMPDYVYDGQGMRIDAVLDDRPAQKAGLQDGDVIIKLGDTEVKDVYDYMEGLSKFEKGDRALIQVKRKEKVMEMTVEF